MLSCTSISSAEGVVVGVASHLWILNVVTVTMARQHHPSFSASLLGLCMMTDSLISLLAPPTPALCAVSGIITSSAVLWTSPILTSAETSPRYTVYVCVCVCVCVCIYRNHDQYRYHMLLSHTSLNHL